MASNESSHDGAANLTPPRPPSPRPSPPPPPPPNDDQVPGDSEKRDKNGGVYDSDGSASPVGEEKEEFIFVSLPEIRKEFQCPICLGIIRKTRTVMECLHRFCRECIDKSMRLGNNECPACRTHCASRRSLRDDPNFDALIAVLYPDVDKYEEEEFSLHEEETVRYRLTQDSIGERFRRQTETVGKKRTRKPSLVRNTRSRRSRRVFEQNDSDEEGTNGPEGSKDSSSADELSTEINPKRSRRSRASQTSPGGNTGFDDKDSDANVHSNPGLVRGKEVLKWASGRVRGKNRRAGLGWARGRLTKGEQLQKLRDYLRGSNQSNKMKISIIVVSLNEEKIRNLQRPYIWCSPKMSVGQLRQYVAMQKSIDARELEILIVKDLHPPENPPVSVEESAGLLSNPRNWGFESLQEHLTMEDVREMFTQKNLVLAYQQKSRDEGN